MEIHIQKGDKGISYAIKRQLQAESVDVSKINSCWTEIMNAFKGDSESKINGKTIGEQWNTLNAKVRCMANDILTIANSTWNKIVGIVNKSAGKSTPSSTTVTDNTVSDNISHNVETGNVETSNRDYSQYTSVTNPQTGEIITYDSQNRIVQEKTFDEYGHDLTREYEYEDNNTRPTKEVQRRTYYLENGKSVEDVKEFTFKYDSQGRIIQSVNLRENITSDYTYEGNSTTPSTEIQTEEWNVDGKTSTNRTEYTYKYGNPPRKIKEEYNSTDHIRTETYEYNDQGVLVSDHCGDCEHRYDSNGNKTQEIWRNPNDNSIEEIIEWTYNDNNQKIHEKKTDGNGNLISETDLDPNNDYHL